MDKEVYIPGFEKERERERDGYVLEKVTLIMSPLNCKTEKICRKYQ